MKKAHKTGIACLAASLSCLSAYAQNNNLKLADWLYLQQKWAAAKPIYARYLGDTSVNAIYWNRLGYCNFHLAKYDGAIADYNRALSNKPSPLLKSTVELRIARVYAVTNKPTEAMKWLTKAAVSGYGNVSELDTLAEFQPMRESPEFKAAYQKIYGVAYPCTVEPHAHDFDFWLGEWDVYQTGTKLLVGHSVVQRISRGCALLENWEALSANNGKSLNYYDANTGKWEQDWIGSGGGAQRYLNGEYKNEAMHFTYESLTPGAKGTGNFIFYNVDKNTVRQYQDMSTDGGKTYQVSYDLTYIRKAPAK